MSDITPDQVRAIHRATYIAEAVGYRGFDEERAAKAYDDRQRWMNDGDAASLRDDRRDALREDDWEIAYTASHIQQAIRLGFVQATLAAQPPVAYSEADVAKLREYAREDWEQAREREAVLISRVAELQERLERLKPRPGYRQKTVCSFCDRQYGHDAECAEKIAALTAGEAPPKTLRAPFRADDYDTRGGARGE